VTVIKGTVGGIASFFTLLIIFLFVLSALFRDQETVINAIKKLNPLGDEITDLYLTKAGAMTGAMVRGQFVIAIAQGFAEAGFLWILGYDYFIFMAMLFSLLSIIPLGAGIIVIPFGIILILTGNVVDGLLILGFHFLIVTNIDNVLRPRLVPKEARLNPALTILAVFAGIAMFGFIGIVIGPVIMILIITTIRVYLDLQSPRSSNVKVSQRLKNK
jgi:predicted PurR-regulated permease PerM